MTSLQDTFPARATAWAVARDYVALTKPGIVRLVLLVTAPAFYMGSGPRPDWAMLARTLVGTARAAAGAGALNQVLERQADARMQRTRQRPLPAGRPRRQTGSRCRSRSRGRRRTGWPRRPGISMTGGLYPARASHPGGGAIRATGRS